jgi:hypothetical protein
MFTKSQKRVVIGATALVVFVLVVVPFITVRRYKASVARTLSQTLGREVSIGDISIQTFPQPGLLMSRVVIGDDPTVSAEPMLRADEVLATIRISSLWRGRLEIGTLKLQYPSVNLVRADDGRWNLESLLERARQTPAAPTAKSRPETRPRFPYIESNGGRINLKLGNEKTVFALNDADFAVWLAAEDEWRMRLEARPIRTDANLSDTGTIKMQGSWRRASQLHETPISVNISWDYGQLGQLTHLVYGRDRGWRGGVHLAVAVTGKPEDLAIRLDGRVDDFRRYDIVSGDSVSLELHCSSTYNFTSKQVRNAGCQMPAGNGMILVRGTYDFSQDRPLDLSLTAENVSLQFLSQVARHAKRDLPNDMNVTGMVSATLTVKGDAGNRLWAGSGQTSPVVVRSSVLSEPLLLEPNRWSLVAPGTEPAVTKSRANRKSGRPDLPPPSGLAWKLQPVAVKIGDDDPATLAGWFSREGYYTELRGTANLQRLFELGKLAGLPTPTSDLTGTAKGAVQVFGEWAGFVPASITGDAQLKNVTAKFSGVAAPLRVTTAHFEATDDSFAINKAVAAFSGVHSAMEFSASWPQHCTAVQLEEPLKCAVQFNVSADQLSVEEINSLLNPKAQKRPWYAALANTVIGAKQTKFPELYAQGKISANKLMMKSVVATHFSSALTLAPKGFLLSDINADLLGGRYTGQIESDFTSETPTYRSSGNLQKLAMPNVAAIMKDEWASGTASLSYRGTAQGWNADELLSSASGTAQFDWREGTLPHIEIDGDGRPLRIKAFAGKFELREGVVTIAQSKLQAPNSIYLVSGTASLGRRLELRLTREGAPSYSITGTLERPSVSLIRSPATQAKLSQSRNR